MTTPRKRTSVRAARSTGRRGVAMMLVIMALGVGAVLATTFVAAKGSSGGIGENAARAARAGWSARSASEIAEAVFETDLDWRTAIADGVLINGQSAFGSNITVQCSDLTGALPTSSTREIVVTVRSVVDGIEDVKQRIVRVIPDGTIQGAVDFSFSEFTVWANNRIDIDASSALGVWDESPESSGLAPVKLGVGFTNKPPLNIDSNAAISETALYAPSDADGPLSSQLGNTQFFISGVKLPVHLPAIPFAAPAALDALPPGPGGAQTISAATVTLPAGFYPSLTVDNGSEVTLDDSLGDYAFDTLVVQNGSTLLIKGNVRVKINNSWDVTTLSAVEYATGSSTLHVFADGAILFDDCALGFKRLVANDPARDPFNVNYVNPGRLRIDMVASALPGSQTITLRNNALVAGAIHAPHARVTLSNGGVLFGRLTGFRVSVLTGSMILGDPSLDPGIAFTRLDGPLYDDPTALTNALATITPAMDAASAAAAVVFSLLGAQAALPGGVIPIAIPAASPPTPRFSGRVLRRDWPVAVMAFEARSRNAAATGTGGTGTGGTGTGGGGGGGGGMDSGLMETVIANTQQTGGTLQIN